ncbi:MAG: cyclodeaminase/cyclohydrolase family protein [Candidatus Woesearchaeota archaeon]
MLLTRRRILENLPSMAEVDTYQSGGTVAAQVARLAASLAAAVADRSRETWDESGGARAQAQALERRVLQLAERQAAAFATAREALARRGEREPVEAESRPERDRRLGAALEAAAAPPLDLAAGAADIAALSAAIAKRAPAELRPDAAVAAMLSAAAARSAAHLVQVNLVVGDRSAAVLARRYADAAAAAAASIDPS